VQVDGEPCLMRPSRIEISLDKRHPEPARMLLKNKNGSCNIIKVLSFPSVLVLHPLFPVSGAIRDDEIENWAAKKIQRSFKEYKSNVRK
jgi:hypothetical protein